jgi:hypothetical protein
MALANYRFRKTDASAALDDINDRLAGSAVLVDQAGGQVVTVQYDDSATNEADLIDVMAQKGYALIEGSGGAGVTGTAYDDHEQRQDQMKAPVRVVESSDLVTAGWVSSGGGKNKTLTSPSDSVSFNDFDSITFTAGVGQRVLLTGLTPASHNGIYFLETAADGAGQNAVLKRAYDADEDEEVLSGMSALVVEGSQEKKIYALKTTGTITVDTTSLTFEAIRADVDAAENLLFGAGKLVTSTTTNYLFPCYSDSLAQTTAIQFRASRAGILRNMYVRHNITGGNGNAIVYTLRKNGIATALTVSLASTANDGSDLVNSVSVAKGDLIDVEVTKAAGIGGTPRDITVSMEFAA